MSTRTLDAERAAVAEASSRWLAEKLPQQRLDGSDQDGGFQDGNTGGWCDGRETAYRLARLIACACWGSAIAVERAKLAEAIRRAAKFIIRRQAPEGGMDLGGYYTPNEAGFPVPGLVSAWKHLSKTDPQLFAEIQTDLKQFITRAAEAVLAGEAYTANHRWAAACAPLAAAYTLFPDPRYLLKIDSYLADGIDCDQDGFWYEERSPNYNMVANNGLITTADCLNRPELLQPVLRNFQFLLSMQQPNGEIDSSFSHRQDRAAADRPLCSYTIARRVALLTGDGRFTTMALDALAREVASPHSLGPAIFELDDRPQAMPEPLPIPTEYERFFERASLARMRRGQTALTLVADHGGHFYDTVRDQWGGQRFSDDWFHLHHGDLVIQSLQVAPAGMFAIQPRSLSRVSQSSYSLKGQAPGWTHTLHFRPGSSTIHMPWGLEHSIDVIWKEQSINMHLKCTSPHSLIASLNLWIRPGVELREGGGDAVKLRGGETISLKGGVPLTVQSASTKLQIAGLPKADHQIQIVPSQPIPSGMPKTCALLCLGLRMPVELSLQLTY